MTPVTSLNADPVKDLLALAAAQYAGFLKTSAVAVRYLQGRGISGAAAAKYGLGFSGHLRANLGELFQGVDRQVIDDSGLVCSGKSSAMRFDRFRSRVMFPIKNEQGEIVGFGGRILDPANNPKYLNSPESNLFKKRELLYGLYEALPLISSTGAVYVVEGYLDVVSLYQNGVGNCVATLGTACTDSHIKTLASKAKKIIFCFDGDKAGRRAATRSLDVLLPQLSDSFEAKFLFLPADHDPDSYIRNFGTDAFLQESVNAKSLLDVLKLICTDGRELKYAEEKSMCFSRAKHFWKLMPECADKEELLNFACQVCSFELEEVIGIWTLP